MGFVSKHKERDSELPIQRNKLLQAIENDLLIDDHVLGFFYGGSIANDHLDNYSDIDLRIIVKPEKMKEYITNKNNRAGNWGNVLYFEDSHPSSIYVVAHYDCFVKVDIFYYTPDYIQPSVWLQNIKIMKDNRGMLANVLEQSMKLAYKPSVKEFEVWRTKFFALLHEAYRRMMRDEYYYALDCIDKMRLSIVSGWCMIAGIQPNSFGDWAKYEGERSRLKDWQQDLLESWDCGRNKVEIIDVVRSIVPEFKKIHYSLCRRLEIEEDSEQLNRIIYMVL